MTTQTPDSKPRALIATEKTIVSDEFVDWFDFVLFSEKLPGFAYICPHNYR